MQRWGALPKASRRVFARSASLASTGLLLASMLVLTGCASPFHRTSGTACSVAAPASLEADWEPPDGPCRESWAVRAPSHGVNYVEIDEQGMLHDRAAAEDALAFAAAPPSEGATMAYVVVFIHGWHHDAAPGDENVQSFHRALSAVSRWRPQADVRGIYIGWRGSSLPVPLLRYLTFWERKSTSDEIGRGGLLEFLLRLERSVKPVEASGNRLVLVGHSFGASVAFNSLAHVFMQRFVEGLYSTSDRQRFRGYGDLTVLINPAIEAMRYMPLQSAVEYYASRETAPRLDFSHERKPRLVILSSNGDLATHCTFPLARFFSTALEAHNRISPEKSPDEQGRYVEWNMDRDTVGNFADFRTHWPLRLVTDDPDAAGPATAPARFIECTREIFAAVARPSEPPPTRLEQCRTPTAEQLAELLRQESENPDLPPPAEASQANDAVDANTYADPRPNAGVNVDPKAKARAGPQVRGSYFPDSRIRVVRRPSAIRNSPYIVAGVGTEIIASHSGVGSPNLMCWINQLVDGE